MASMRDVAAIAVVLGTAVLAPAQWNPEPVTLPVTEGSDLRFDHLPLGIGPSHRRITGIVQDDLGFLWLGTDDGLKRYDGYRVRDFRQDPKNPNSLPDNYIVSLFKDRSGKLWVASGRYLDVYDPATEKFTPVCAAPGSAKRFNARVGQITQDRAGTIWLSTDKGLYEVDPGAGVRFHYSHDPKNASSLSSDLVHSTLETKDGTFWVATGEGVDSIHRRSHQVTRRVAFALAHSLYTTMIEDHAGVLWIAYSGAHGPGLATIDRNANTLTHYRVNPAPEKVSPGVRTVYEDVEGQLWVAASNGGLYKLDAGRTRFVRYRNNPTDPATLASDQPTVLFEDREGGVWVGTHGDGVDRFTRKPLPFRRYVHEPGNPDSLEKDSVTAVFQDSSGALWIGCIRSLVKVDPHTGKFEFFRSHGMPRPGEYVHDSSDLDGRGPVWRLVVRDPGRRAQPGRSQNRPGSGLPLRQERPCQSEQ